MSTLTSTHGVGQIDHLRARSTVYVHVCVGVCDSGTDGELVGVCIRMRMSLLHKHMHLLYGTCYHMHMHAYA